MSITTRTTAVPEIDYPSSDGQPLGETGWHVESTLTLFGVLKHKYADRPDVYVAANMFLYYEEGNPKAHRSPDCMVILGVRGNHPRRWFKTWAEGVVPAVVFEFASPETYREDLGPKREFYARLGVTEYFLFDPVGECLDPRLQGYRLAGHAYESLTPDADGGLTSRVLDLRFVPEGFLLRVIDLATGQSLLTYGEFAEGYRRADAERDRERQVAEREHRRAEAAQRRAEAAQRRVDAAQRRAEAETRRAELERQAAEHERRRAEASEAEVERLRALLEQRDRPE